MRTTSLLSSFAALVFGSAVIGCSPADTNVAGESQGGAKPVVSPKERLEEERMTAATAGLDFSGPVVKVVRPMRADKKTAATLLAKADAEIGSRNVWFLSVGAYRDAILANPGDARGYLGLARAFLIESENDRAEKSLRTAVGLDSRLTKARFLLGTLRQGAGDYSGALTEWRAVAKIDPSYPDIYARMAIASYYAEDFRSSWAYVNEAQARKQSVPPQFKSLLKEAAPQP